MEAKELRDAVIETLRKDRNIAVSELNGNYFYGADIAVDDGSAQPKVFRLAIVEYEQKKRLHKIIIS